MKKDLQINNIRCANCANVIVTNEKKYRKKKYWENRNHFCSILCQRQFQKLQNHPMWKGGKERLKINWRRYKYNGFERQRFREKVMKSVANYCVFCRKAYDLIIHHIKPINQFPELQFNEDNVAILCRDCHTDFHAKHGQNICDWEKFYIYINETEQEFKAV